MPDSSLPADLPRDLHYVDDTQPGIRRKKVRGKFQYLNCLLYTSPSPRD